MPTTGKRPVTMPRLTRIWLARSTVQPTARKLPSESRAPAATSKPRSVRSPYVPSSPIAPAKPHDSAKAAKTKSVWRSGRNARRLWVPPKRPFPQTWPEPMVILAWITFQALPSGSREGSTNTRSRSVAERLGMRQEGVLRGGVRTPQGFLDLVIYGILEDEWRAPAR